MGNFKNIDFIANLKLMLNNVYECKTIPIYAQQFHEYITDPAKLMLIACQRALIAYLKIDP